LGASKLIRITAGELKGRILKTPKGDVTRPSPARLREALFNVLGEEVRDRVFLDLYAGSGAVGFEALSRGAPHVVLVDRARAAVACIKDNLRLLHPGRRVQLLAERLPAWLRTSGFPPGLPLCIFLDPPFHEGLAHETLEILGEVTPIPPGPGWQNSLVFAQTEKAAELQETYGPWSLLKRYKHGDSALWVYELGEGEPGTDHDDPASEG